MYAKSLKFRDLAYTRGWNVCFLGWFWRFSIFLRICFSRARKRNWPRTACPEKYHKTWKIGLLWYDWGSKISQMLLNSHFMIQKRGKNIINASILKIYDIERLQKYHKSLKNGNLWYRRENISNVLNSTLLRYRRACKYLKSLKNQRFEILARREISQMPENRSFWDTDTSKNISNHLKIMVLRYWGTGKYLKIKKIDHLRYMKRVKISQIHLFSRFEIRAQAKNISNSK